jgi:hypothetical protein
VGRSVSQSTPLDPANPTVGQSVGQEAAAPSEPSVIRERDRRSKTPPQAERLPIRRVSSKPGPKPGTIRLSESHKQAIARARRVDGVRRGRVASMTHGIFSQTLLAPDVATEVLITYAAYPALDPIADRRLVELASTVRVQRHRCLAAMQEHGLIGPLTSYDRGMATLEERMERAVYERQRQRVQEFGKRPLIDLRQYEPLEDDPRDE